LFVVPKIHAKTADIFENKCNVRNIAHACKYATGSVINTQIAVSFCRLDIRLIESTSQRSSAEDSWIPQEQEQAPWEWVWGDSTEGGAERGGVKLTPSTFSSVHRKH